jgi:tetratricopeptide (TPR) repeat protein
MAWGPKTQQSIVSTAAHLISSENSLPLSQLDSDLRHGATVSQDLLKSLYPSFSTNPVSAIEEDMYLLQVVHRGKISPYFAYRLGVLGKLIADVTSPMSKASATYRNLYYADVEINIQRLSVLPMKSQNVEPKSYFERRIAEANLNNEFIQRDYQSGTGFAGMASKTLRNDASRSVSSITDVWQSVLTEQSSRGYVSETQLQRYVLDAMSFYIRRGNASEVAAMDAQLATLVSRTADMQVQLGDMYYKGGFHAQAVSQYETVLASHPSRRDVIEKISVYYIDQGETMLMAEQLEGALDAFAMALKANPLNTDAERKRLDVQTRIAKRDARMAADQAVLDQAEEFRALAEEEVLREHFAEAIAFLRQSDRAYAEVSNEFPMEYQKRERGLREVRSRIESLRKDLMANAQIFRGTGFHNDAKVLARTRVNSFDTEALQKLVRISFEEELAALVRDMESAVEIQK